MNIYKRYSLRLIILVDCAKIIFLLSEIFVVYNSI